MRVLTDTDDPVEIMLASSKSQILFHVEGVDIVSRLIDGQFPNYQQVLPSSHSTRAVVERDELLKAVRISALIASAAANVVRMRLGDEGNGPPSPPRRTWVRHRPRSKPRSKATRSRSRSTRYLQALSLDQDQLALEFLGSAIPGRPQADNVDEDYVHVIMPVRTPS